MSAQITERQITKMIEVSLEPVKKDIADLSSKVDKTNQSIHTIEQSIEKISIALTGDGVYNKGLVKDVEAHEEYINHATNNKFSERIDAVLKHYEKWLEDGKWDKVDDVIKEKEAYARFRKTTGVSNVASTIGFIISLLTLLKLLGVF